MNVQFVDRNNLERTPGLFYHRSKLNESYESEVYDSILRSAFEMQEYAQVNFSRVSQEHAFRIFQSVLDDHPELFWVDSNLRVSNANGRIYFDYTVSRDEQTNCANILNDKVSTIVERWMRKTSEYDVALASFEYIANHVCYNHSELGRDSRDDIHSYSAYGAIVNNLAVCEGFAKAYQLLLQRFGIMAVKATGETSVNSIRRRHTWLIARIDGKFCHIDPTWAALTGNNVEHFQPRSLVHDYFGLCDVDISQTHVFDSTNTLPACTSRMNDYFRREGYVIRHWNYSSYLDLFKRQILGGCVAVETKASCDSVYNAMIDELVEHKMIANVIHDVERITQIELPSKLSYSTSRELRTLCIFIGEF